MSSSEPTKHFLNGKLVTEEELLIPVRDLGFARGYAIFDFFITYKRHRPFKLDKHIDRLFNSAKLIGLKLPWTKKQIHDWTTQTLDANLHQEYEKAIKIIVSGGVSSSLVPQGTPTIVILIDRRQDYPKEYFEKGVSVITDKFMRYIPGAKSNNYIEGVRQMQIASKTGAIEPIYYDDKQIFEGATCNIFAVIGKKLITPKSNILPGITRDILLKILKLKVPVKVADFSRKQLLAADEVFLTASNKEVMPVTKIDGKKIGSGKVGPITQEVMRQFREFTSSNKW